MRLPIISSILLLSSSLATSASLPHLESGLSLRDIDDALRFPERRDDDLFDLEKRRGGGGGKGGGGKSGGGSSSGSSGSSGGRPASSYSFSSSSNAGGRTRGGSGPKPAFGGGRYYAGGAAVPYASGARSPLGVTPFLLPITAVAFFPALWLYSSIYAYPYNYNYRYRNTTGQNDSIPVTCLCQQYSVCGCDNNGNTTNLDQLVSNGTDAPQNSSNVRVVRFPNGTRQAYVNGTLPNGTTADGGTDPNNADQVSMAERIYFNYAGYWVMVATVLATVTML